MTSNVQCFTAKYASLLFNESLFFPDIQCAKMSIAKANRRKCKEVYIKYDFTCLQIDGGYSARVSCA